MPDRNSRIHYIVRFYDFGQAAEMPVPRKYSETEAHALALSVGGTLHRITVTEEIVTLVHPDRGE